MKLAWPRLGLPLLMKELFEQAARRRTYVVRAVYASMLLLFGLLIYYSSIANRSVNPFAVLGRGRDLFMAIVMMQFLGIYFFMPAMACGVVTGEKERNSLGLLFLTRLGPWTILLEKYLSRVIPMLSFLLPSLPLLVIAYSLGGITPAYLWSGIWLLVLTVFQVGAIALFCSAFFRSTASAFITTYLIGVLLMFGPVFCEEGLRIPISRWVEQFVQVYVPSWPVRGMFRDSVWFLGPAVFGNGRAASGVWATVSGLPILLSAISFLLLARLFVVRRAFLPATHALLALFRLLDRYFYRVNHNRLTRGIVLINDPDPLYITQPVAWRETTKTALGSARHLIRLLLIIEFPVAVIVIVCATSHTSDGISAVLFVLWVLSVMIMAVKGASLISGERSSETLDVLLTTKMRTGEIVREKVSGLRRLNFVLAIPLLTCIFFKAWMDASGAFRHRSSGSLYLTCALLAVAIYLPLAGWFSLWIGLRVRKHSRAIFGAIAGLAGWCIGPLVVLGLTFSVLNLHVHGRHPAMLLMLLSPMTIIPFNEFSDLDDVSHNSEWLAVVLNFLFYGGCLMIFRTLCTQNIGKYLGRLENN